MAFDLGVFGAQPVRRWGQMTPPAALRQWPAQAPAQPMATAPAMGGQAMTGTPPPGRKGGFGDLMDSVQVQPSGMYGNPDRFNGNNTVRNGASQAFASMGERGGVDPRDVAVRDSYNTDGQVPLGGSGPLPTVGNPDRFNGDNTVRQGGGIGNMAGGVRRFNITSQPRRSSMIYTGR